VRFVAHSEGFPMSSKKIAETIQQAREWARAEYETKTKGLIFTKDFQSRQEALMHDPMATIGERVMAWILRRSWGEYVLYAIREDGEPAYQRDCARELGIDKRKVSNAIAYNQKRGYLENHPKKLYPVISPVLGGPPQKVTRSPDFLQFIENWKVTHSSDFQELEVARSTVERIRKVILSDYKKSRRADKNGDVSLLETIESNSETRLRAVLSPLEASNQRHKQAPAKPTSEGRTQSEHLANARKILFDHVEHMQKAFPNTPFSRPPIDRSDPGDQGLVDRILKEIGTTEEQEIIGFVVWCSAKFKGIGKGGMHVQSRAPGTANGPASLGLLVNWAVDYARVARPKARGAP
jgi:hypothetical protein